MPTWFEHVPRNTFMHRLNPLTKLIIVVSIFVVLSVYWDIRYLALSLIPIVVMYWNSKTPVKWILLIGTPFVVYRSIEAFILGMTQIMSSFKTMPPELVTSVLFSIGPITLRYGSLLWALAYVFRIFLVLGVTFVFIYTVSLNDLIKALRGIHIPSKITYIATVALRFIPELIREVNLTWKAQSLRGWKLKTRNPKRLVRMARPVAAPFTSRVVGYVDRLTLTTQIRAFGGETKSYERIRFNASDWIMSILFITWLVSAIYLSVAYGIGTI